MVVVGRDPFHVWFGFLLPPWLLQNRLEERLERAFSRHVTADQQLICQLFKDRPSLTSCKLRVNWCDFRMKSTPTVIEFP